MKSLSRLITGIGSIIVGIYIVIITVPTKPEGYIWSIFWGVFFIALGLYIFFNDKEDSIEEIKNNKDK